jgi:hypothetical protein
VNDPREHPRPIPAAAGSVVEPGAFPVPPPSEGKKTSERQQAAEAPSKSRESNWATRQRKKSCVSARSTPSSPIPPSSRCSVERGRRRSRRSRCSPACRKDLHSPTRSCLPSAEEC